MAPRLVPELRAMIRLLALLALGATLGACAGTVTRQPVPSAALASGATVAGLDGIRSWGDFVPVDLAAEVRRRLPNLPRLAGAANRSGGRPIVETLALSGGGPDGAFGAGFLAGWTKRGDRPEFEVVTGVSAGAIIAPFAYLGPAYDRQLREIWTEYETSQLLLAQIVPGLLGGPALADTGPLAKLIARYVDRAMIEAIAREYRRGRMLFVGTTNLDAQRFVVWNIGEIALRGGPRAAPLVRDVILASAAIPGAFPPVNIAVETGGARFDEMHVDGGTTREIFVSPVQVPLSRFDVLYGGVKPVRRLYLIKNGKLAPTYQPVTPQALPIAGRAISTLILQQSLGEIYRIYRIAKDDGADFNLTAIPTEFALTPKQVFDPVYQAALFDVGFKMGNSGSAWLKVPPEVLPSKPEPTEPNVTASAVR